MREVFFRLTRLRKHLCCLRGCTRGNSRDIDNYDIIILKYTYHKVLYIYIYICVCVCVCIKCHMVYIYTCIFEDIYLYNIIGGQARLRWHYCHWHFLFFTQGLEILTIYFFLPFYYCCELNLFFKIFTLTMSTECTEDYVLYLLYIVIY